MRGLVELVRPPNSAVCARLVKCERVFARAEGWPNRLQAHIYIYIYIEYMIESLLLVRLDRATSPALVFRLANDELPSLRLRARCRN